MKQFDELEQALIDISRIAADIIKTAKGKPTDKERIDEFFKEVIVLAEKHGISCIEDKNDNTFMSFENGIFANMKVRFAGFTSFINYENSNL